MNRRLVIRLAVVLAAGVLVAALVGVAANWPARDIAVTTLLAAGGGLAAGLAGAAVIRRARGRSSEVQALAVAFTSIGVLVTGIVVAARAMFISSHDLAALVVVVAISAAMAVGAAMQLGQDIGTGARQIGVIALELGDEATGSRVAVPGPLELTTLADRLDEASLRLEESTRRERALESSRRELISWVSHDLRGPLASIRAMAEALDDQIVTEGDIVRRYHSQIHQDAERLSRLVDDLFELSRIHNGSLRLEPRPVMLCEVVADAVAEARVQAEIEGVTVEELIEDLPEMEVGAGELTRVLRNLLDNAIRHSPAGGTVLVESVVDDGGVTFAVTDECGGLPEPDLTRVFDVAYRGDVSRGRAHGGGDLGLAVAKGLVEAHDGSIEVANRAPGCRFTVRLGRPG